MGELHPRGGIYWQAALFSPAVESKQRAIEALRVFDAEAALDHLQEAREIDPGLAEIDSLSQVARFLRRAGSQQLDAAGLSQIWVRARAAYVMEEMSRWSLSFLEHLVCRTAIRMVSHRFRSYLDPENPALHIGYCYLVEGDPVRAHRRLFDDLARRPLPGNGDLWGYLGDAALELRFVDRANKAYVRGLFGDPERVDLRSIHHTGIRRLYDELRSRHKEIVARHLLPIYAWLHAHLHIRSDDRAFLNAVNRLLRRNHETVAADGAEGYRLFALHLYNDQAATELFDLRSRAAMERIDPELFSRYFELVESRGRGKPDVGKLRNSGGF